MGHECPGGFKMLLQLMPSGEASSEGGPGDVGLWAKFRECIQALLLPRVPWGT